MRIPASIATIARVALLSAAVAACTHAGGKLMVDVPKLLPYQPPDIDEITGIDSSEEPAAPAPSQGSAQNPHK